jgi:hypothetical protein
MFRESTPAPGRRRLALSAGALALTALLGCPMQTQEPDPEPEPEPIFPANYRDTYTEVRDCRNSTEHGATIRVWVNDVGAAAYRADENPLPVGTIVVKEEFVGADCGDDDDLMFWSVMRKEAPGFDAADADWRFQEVGAPNRNVRLDNKVTCIDCHREPDCVARDYMCTDP